MPMLRCAELQVRRITVVRDVDYQFRSSVGAHGNLPLPADREIHGIEQFRFTMGRFEDDHGVAQPPNVGTLVRFRIGRAPDQRTGLRPEHLAQLLALLSTQRTIAASRTPL